MSTQQQGHTVETEPSEKLVRVTVGGELIAESRRALALHETHLRTRWYLPLEDVREGVLEASEKTSHCPFKGDASYYSVRAAGELHPDVAWTYRDPIPEVREIAGLVCFYDEKVELTLDPPASAEPLPPPRSTAA
jgi:uncharacterized protein (DUF427 family)